MFITQVPLLTSGGVKLREKAGSPGIYEKDPNQGGLPGYMSVPDTGFAGPAAPRYGATPPGYTPSVDTGKSELDKAREELFGSIKDLTGEDEEKIREGVRGRFKTLEDAITQTFNQMLQREVKAGQGRLGQGRAISNIRGEIGSSFGEARQTGIESYNLEQQQEIESRKNAALATLYADIDRSATEEIKYQREARAGNVASYQKYLENKETKSLDSIKNLAATGYKLENLSAKDYQDLVTYTGMKPWEMEAYYNVNMPAELKTQYENYTVALPNGNAALVRVGVDPLTGQTTKKQFDLGVNYEQIKGANIKEVDGILYKVNPATGDLKQLTQKQTKLTDYPSSYQEWVLAGKPGTYADFIKKKTGGVEPTKDEISAVNRFAQQLEGFDAKVDLPKITPGSAEFDQGFFYSILQKAVEKGGEFPLQPFKYPYIP